MSDEVRWSRPPVLIHEGDSLILMTGSEKWVFEVVGARRSLTGEEVILEVAPPCSREDDHVSG